MSIYQVTYQPYLWNKREYGEERVETFYDKDVIPVLENATSRPTKNHRITRIVKDGMEYNVDSFLADWKKTQGTLILAAMEQSVGRPLATVEEKNEAAHFYKEAFDVKNPL